MNILFNDILQKSDAPKSLISPALADRYRYTGPLDITLDKTRKFDALGIGGTDAGTISIGKIATPAGIKWNITKDSTFESAPVGALAYANGKFVAGGYSGKLAYSADGSKQQPFRDVGSCLCPCLR
jgi:hypothetical protein